METIVPKCISLTLHQLSIKNGVSGVTPLQSIDALICLKYTSSDGDAQIVARPIGVAARDVKTRR